MYLSNDITTGLLLKTGFLQKSKSFELRRTLYKGVTNVLLYICINKDELDFVSYDVCKVHNNCKIGLYAPFYNQETGQSNLILNEVNNNFKQEIDRLKKYNVLK